MSVSNQQPLNCLEVERTLFRKYSIHEPGGTERNGTYRFKLNMNLTERVYGVIFWEHDFDLSLKPPVKLALFNLIVIIKCSSLEFPQILFKKQKITDIRMCPKILL